VSRRTSIGLDRRVDMEWLDAAAAQVAAGHDVAATRAELFEALEGKIAGGSKRGSACYKTVCVLSRTWANVPTDLVGFRDRALKILPSLSSRERLGLHWAMLLAGYQFFGDVAGNTGRLLTLQGNLTLSQLTRRMRETWGDRSTLNRATQRVVRSMVEWGALIDTEQRGVYSHEPQQVILPVDLGMLLIEAILLHTGKMMPIEQIMEHPALFPFEMNLRMHELRRSARFGVHRQGLDVDVVGLRNAGREGSNEV
jgi:hypothetical protein